jgi:hypothetical protein
MDADRGVLRWNVLYRLRAHEVLAPAGSHNFFSDAQSIEQHQNFEESLGILVFQVGRSRAWWHDKAQESIKLQFPFNGKPALKHWDDLAGPNRLKWGGEMPWLGAFNLCDQPTGSFVFAKFFRKNSQNLVDDSEAAEVMLLLRFADEVMNPEIPIGF